MNRFVVVACAFWVTAVAGCDTLFPSGGGKSGGLTGLDPDGGVCEKDPQTIKNVMLAPPTCNATNPCPCGTFCSSQTGGNCVADCVDDSWCAPGHTCSGYGQCLAATDGGAGDGGPGPSVDPACPRNEALLDSMEVMNRSCQFDDQCPFGSYCDHVKGRCYSACRSDTFCASLNSPGHTFVCGCLGQCAEVAAPRVKPATELPNLEVTPSHFTFARPSPITTPVWGGGGTRKIEVDIVTPFVTTSGMTITGPTATIHANPGPGLMIECPNADGSVSDFSSSPCIFSVDPATFRLTNDVYRTAPVVLTLKPSDGAPTATNWVLRLESSDVGNAPQTVVLRYDANVLPTPPTQNFVSVDAPNLSFRGTGQIQFRTPTGAPMVIPVHARTWTVCNVNQCSDALVLSDDTQQISPSGKLVVRVGQDIPGFIDVASDSDAVLVNTMSGSLPQQITGTTLFEDQNSGAVSGQFSRAIYTDNFRNHTGALDPFDTPTVVTVDLRPTASTAGFCSQDSDCPVSARCDLGFCSAGTRYRASASSAVTGELLVQWFKSPQVWGQSTTTNETGLKAMFVPNSSYSSLPGLFLAFNDSMFPVSGDPVVRVKWTGSGISEEPQVGPFAIPLLTNQDTHSLLTKAQSLSSCLSEMGAATNFDFSNCVNLKRVGLALGDRVTFQSMLAGTLDVSSFVAREGLEESRLADALAGAPLDPNASAVTAQAPSLQQVLGVTEIGLGLFLNAGSGQNAPYQTMSANDIWSTIDYRRFVTTNTGCFPDGCSPGTVCEGATCVPVSLTEKPHWEQPLGVPTHAIRAAASYLKVLDAYLQQTAGLTYGQPADGSPASARQTALARYGTAMRLVLAVEQLAVAINIRANVDTTNATCPGNPQDCAVIAQRFNAASDELNIIRARAMRTAQILQAGANPFNIPEDDVPLFFGDPSGTNSRYFAASDYLLNGWAIPAVSQAQAFLDAARASWIQQTQATVQDELNKHNRQQEIDGLMSKYGAPILANCGNIQVPNETSGGLRLLDSTEVIPYFSDPKRAFSNGACFIDQSCGGSPGSLDERAELRFVINNAYLDDSGAFRPVPPGVGTFGNAASAFAASEICKLTLADRYVSRHFSDAFASGCENLFRVTNFHTVCDIQQLSDQNLYFVSTNPGTGQVVNVPLAALFEPIRAADVGPGKFYAQASPPDSNNPFVFPGASTGTFELPYTPNNIYHYDNYRRFYGPVRQLDGTSSNRWDEVTRLCETPGSGRLYDQDRHNAVRDVPPPQRDFLPAACYKGQMGVAFEEERADVLRMQRAQEVLDSGKEDLQDQMDLCKHIDLDNMKIMEVENHFAAMKKDYELVSSLVGGFQGGLKIQEIAESIELVNLSSYATAIGVAGGIGSVVLDMFGASVQDEATHLQQMERDFAASERSQQCWNTFLSQRRALATAMTDIQIATANMFAQQVRFKNLADDNILFLQEGKAALEQEKASPVSSLGHQFWVNEKVEQFSKEFEWSRRLVYMAMRAVEYEFQQSLPYRSQIVSAKTPAQLQDAVIGLQQEEASRTINRRRPSEASIVVSLRDDVLAIADRTDAPSGERNWTAAQRFASRLYDTRYGYRDSEGTYLGQAIPFTLGPFGVLATRCGERLWRATATVQGDGIEPSAPGSAVLLLKRNTFASQYCDGKAPTSSNGGPPPQMQVGVIHTSADLFRPGSEVDLSDANQFTASLLYPWFNIPRTQFYSTTYQQGSSEELAGRGLYGDYVLLFPKEVLDDGFALDKVEDVLLRLDYLSVDNLSQ